MCMLNPAYSLIIDWDVIALVIGGDGCAVLEWICSYFQLVFKFINVLVLSTY